MEADVFRDTQPEQILSQPRANALCNDCGFIILFTSVIALSAVADEGVRLVAEYRLKPRHKSDLANPRILNSTFSLLLSAAALLDRAPRSLIVPRLSHMQATKRLLLGNTRNSSVFPSKKSYFLATLPWKITDERDKFAAIQGAKFDEGGDIGEL